MPVITDTNYEVIFLDCPEESCPHTVGSVSIYPMGVPVSAEGSSGLDNLLAKSEHT